MRSSSFWLNFFLICVGIVLGAMVAEMTAGTENLGWLAYGLDFGTETPLVLNLGILRLTFGLSFKITVSTALCTALALLLGRVIDRK